MCSLIKKLPKSFIELFCCFLSHQLSTHYNIALSTDAVLCGCCARQVDTEGKPDRQLERRLSIEEEWREKRLVCRMPLCAVCCGPASHWCGGCSNLWYCSPAHQRQHWADHKSNCRPTRVESSPQLGKYLVAARALQPGQLLVAEECAVRGPGEEPGDTPVCLSCYFPAHHTCPVCSAPLCGAATCEAGDHAVECETVGRAGLGRDPAWLDLVPALRLLLLRHTDPARYARCAALSTNLAEREAGAGPGWADTQARAARLSQLFPGLCCQQEALTALCLLDTNTFQVLAAGSAHTLAGLFPRAALLNHSCQPNCRLVFRADYTLQVFTSVAVPAGEPLTISYTPPFYSVLARAQVLQRGKQFSCSCPRCRDPTELDTRLSSPRCREGTGCPGHYLPTGPPATSDWTCDTCPHLLSAKQYALLDARLFAVQTNLDRENVAGLKAVLEQFSPGLHPDHALLTETRQHLAAALGRVPGYRYDQLSREDLQLKVFRICYIGDVIPPFPQ